MNPEETETITPREVAAQNAKRNGYDRTRVQQFPAKPIACERHEGEAFTGSEPRPLMRLVHVEHFPNWG